MAARNLSVVDSTPAPASSGALAEQLEAERSAHEAAIAQLNNLATERRDLLLGDDDQALADHDALIAATERKRDRHEARSGKLEQDVADAEKREADEAKWLRYREVERQCADAREWMENHYNRLAGELAQGLAALKAADAAAERMNDHHLPYGASNIQPPSWSRHEPHVPSREETQKVLRWVSSTGNPLTGVQTIDGKPSVPGARMVEVQESVTVYGKQGWRPPRLYDAIEELPGLHRADERFWPPRND